MQRRVWELYSHILEGGLAYHESLPVLDQRNKGRPKRRKGHNLVLRLLAHKVEVLSCLSHAEVSFSNNQAERDLRMVKVRQTYRTVFGVLKERKRFVLPKGFYQQHVRGEVISLRLSSNSISCSRLHSLNSYPLTRYLSSYEICSRTSEGMS